MVCWAPRCLLVAFGSAKRLMLTIALLLLICFIFVEFHGFSWRRVGVGYALRVFPPVTRLTVYRPPQAQVSVTIRQHATRQRNRTTESRTLSSQRLVYHRFVPASAPANDTCVGITIRQKHNEVVALRVISILNGQFLELTASFAQELRPSVIHDQH